MIDIYLVVNKFNTFNRKKPSQDISDLANQLKQADCIDQKYFFFLKESKVHV